MGVLPTNDGKYALVADPMNSRIAGCSAKDLSYLTEWKDSFILINPTFLAQAPGAAGHVFVSDYFSSSLADIDPTAVNPSTTAAGWGMGKNFRGLAVDAQGTVLRAGAGASKTLTRARVAASLSILGSTALAFTPLDVAADRKNGKVYVTDQINGAVVSFDSADYSQVHNAAFITGYEPSALTGVAVDAAGYIFLLDNKYGKLQKNDSAGKLLSTWGGSLMSPNGVAVGADGVVWVTRRPGALTRSHACSGTTQHAYARGVCAAVCLRPGDLFRDVWNCRSRQQ